MNHHQNNTTKFDKNTPIIDFLINKRKDISVIEKSNHIAIFIPSNIKCFI